MKKFKTTLFLLIGINACIFGQGIVANDAFKPSGKPFVKIFSNYHSTFSDGEVFNTFQITRSYFGYGYQLSENISAKVTLDVGNPATGKYERIAFLKHALIKYQKGKITLNFGLIGTYQFKAQEKAFGYRYIYKSFQDAYKFGPSADLGISAKYKISNIISVDASITNGEGYKRVEIDSTFKASFGVSLFPVDGLIIRGYYDYMNTEQAQSTYSVFVAYKHQDFSVGAEYNIQDNHKMIEYQDLSGYSVFSTYKINNKIKVFGRYDNLTSDKIEDTDEPWNIKMDGQYFIAGLEYAPIKGLKISPNYRGLQPGKKDSPYRSSIYLNLEIRF